jgi:hypothetical protein
LVGAFSSQLEKIINHPQLSRLLFLVVKAIHEGFSYETYLILDNREDQLNFVQSLFDTIMENYNSHHKTKNLEKDVIICHPIGHRFVKNLVVDYQNYQNLPDMAYHQQIEKLYQLLEKELPVLLPTKAIFVVIAFIEFTSFKDQVNKLSTC